MISDTLLIKHLPSQLSDAQKESLLKHFGAEDVKCLSSRRKKYNVVFARFPTPRHAENVLQRLHQLSVEGTVLSVEYAKEKQHFNDLPKSDVPDVDTNEKEKQNEKLYNKFIDRLHSWHSGTNFKQPVPTHLQYQYPPPDKLVLSNIAKVLATVPKFYNQVLHLMNKMNLPCPFNKIILPHLELRIEEKSNTQEEIAPSIEEPSEESESEISSDEDVKKQKEIIPVTAVIKKKKLIKKPKFLKPTVTSSKKRSRKTLFEDVFESIKEDDSAKKVKLSYPSVEELNLRVEETIVQTKPAESVTSEPTGFGYIHPLHTHVKEKDEESKKVDLRDEREEERLEKETIVCISSKDLASNRLSEKDRLVLPVFKNYAEGAPTCRLYIKNLSKSVSEDDLRFIYSKYIPEQLFGDPNMFDIRLMQEGRMKGQAFVTLQTIELAKEALKETNGYILKDKPIVVQFARSATK